MKRGATYLYEASTSKVHQSPMKLMVDLPCFSEVHWPLVMLLADGRSSSFSEKEGAPPKLGSSLRIGKVLADLKWFRPGKRSRQPRLKSPHLLFWKAQLGI